MRKAHIGRLLLLALCLPSLARAWSVWPDRPGLPNVGITGFLQPSFEYINNQIPGNTATGKGTDVLGFALTRARLIGIADYTISGVTFDARVEIEGTPSFSLYDAYVDAKGALPGGGYLRVVFGQHKAPFLRQVLVWDPNLQFATKSWITGTNVLGNGDTPIAPGHQLGLSASLHVPYASWIQLWVGVYNGEGRNNIQNLDKNFMYVGRLAFRPFGALEPYVESALGANQLSIAVNASYNVRDLGDSDEAKLLVAADVFGCWNGLSLYAEGLYGTTNYTSHDTSKAPAQKNFATIGYNAQAGYLLPIPGFFYRRLEIAGRFQGIKRNDSVDALSSNQLGDLNQAQYDIAAGINYYHFGHSLKLVINYDHYIYGPEPARNGKPFSSDALYALVNFTLE